MDYESAFESIEDKIRIYSDHIQNYRNGPAMELARELIPQMVRCRIDDRSRAVSVDGRLFWVRDIGGGREIASEQAGSNAQ